MKIFLRLLVAGLIICAVVVGVLMMLEPSSDQLILINYVDENVTEQKDDTASNWNFIYQKLVSDPNYESVEFSPELIEYTNKIDDIFSAYLNYYIQLSQFENEANASLKTETYSAIQAYSNAQKETLRLLTNLVSYTSNSQFGVIEFTTQLTNAFTKYKTELNLFYTACSKLSAYVAEVNYLQNAPQTLNTTLLFVQLDFAKVVLNSEFEILTQTSYPLSLELVDIFNKYSNFYSSMSPFSEQINNDKIQFMNAYENFVYKTEYFSSTTKVEMLLTAANFNDDVDQFTYAQRIHAFLTSDAY